MTSLICDLESAYNNSPGESWGEYFARLPHADPVNQKPSVPHLRFPSEFQVKKNKETNNNDNGSKQ